MSQFMIFDRQTANSEWAIKICTKEDRISTVTFSNKIIFRENWPSVNTGKVVALAGLKVKKIRDKITETTPWILLTNHS